MANNDKIDAVPSEVWNDLGYTDKAITKKWNPMRIPEGPIPNAVFSSRLNADQKKAKNLELIKQIDPRAVSDSEGSVKLTIKGIEYEFFLLSDTYSIPSMGRYGSGIKDLVSKILARLSQLA